MLKVAVAFLLMGFSFSAWAQDQQASAFVLCKSKKAVRTIRVMADVKKETCTTTYSKGGVDEVVGQNRDVGQCKSILDKVRDNLENSKWNCREVSKATMTTSSEASRQ